MPTELLYALGGFILGWWLHERFFRWCVRFKEKRDPEFKRRMNETRFHILEKW